MTEETRQWIIERELTHGFALNRVQSGYLQNDSSKFALPCGGTLLVVTTYSQNEPCEYLFIQSAFIISPTGDVEKINHLSVGEDVEHPTLNPEP